MNITKPELQKEVFYKTSRSGGKGGQHVNKVSSKVELLFSIHHSSLFTPDEKVLLKTKLQEKISKDELLHIVCDEERSQYLNKEKAIEKLIRLLTKSLHVPKKRKATSISRAVKERRTQAKKQQSEKKRSRRYSDDIS